MMPSQRTPDEADVGDGWAAQVRDLENQLAVCRQTVVQLQSGLRRLRGAITVAHAVLDPDADHPTLAEQHSALTALHAALSR